MNEKTLQDEIDARIAERNAPSEEVKKPNPVAVELVRLKKRVDNQFAALERVNQERMARMKAHEQLMDEQAAEALRRRSARRGHIISGIVGFFAGSMLAGLSLAQQQRARASQGDER